jgi:outer membrane protein OmpA-like peptidoglycan-associated protein
MTPEGQKALAQAAAAIDYYKQNDLELVGCASPEEADGDMLAERRAQMIAGLLINKYQVEPKRIQVRSNVSDKGGCQKVTVRFASQS